MELSLTNDSALESDSSENKNTKVWARGEKANYDKMNPEILLNYIRKKSDWAKDLGIGMGKPRKLMLNKWSQTYTSHSVVSFIRDSRKGKTHL